MAAIRTFAAGQSGASILALPPSSREVPVLRDVNGADGRAGEIRSLWTRRYEDHEVSGANPRSRRRGLSFAAFAHGR